MPDRKSQIEKQNSMSGNVQPHQIRLAGPWQIETESGTSVRTQLPLIGTATDEPLVVSRSFNGSDGILAAKQIRIRIAFAGTAPLVQLNLQPLQPLYEGETDNQLEFDVTNLVKKSNSLVLTIAGQSCGRVTEASLLVVE